MYTITEKDYTLVENPSSAFHGVKFKTGTWKDVIVVYGQVGVREDESLDLATLSFNYTIQDPADFNVDESNVTASYILKISEEYKTKYVMNFNTLPRKVIIEKGKDVILKCLIELRVKILKFLVFNFFCYTS